MLRAGPRNRTPLLYRIDESERTLKDVDPQIASPAFPRTPKSGTVRRRLALLVLALPAGALLVVVIMLPAAGPVLKRRVIETVSAKFDSRVELEDFHVSLLRGFEISGSGLRIFAPDQVVAAGMVSPIITVEHFTFHTGLLGLFASPTHVGEVHVRGLILEIPPKEWRRSPASGKRPGKIGVVADRIVCDDSRLVIDTIKPGKDPKLFLLQHIILRELGPDQPWQYDATLINPVPRGDIQATGTFGPWQVFDPGAAAVTGHYLFDHVDLNTIKGIGGTLRSTGDFHGQLDRIAVDGTTTTPNFSLDTANHPLRLETKFHALVDGTTGDTYLQPVQAKLGRTEFTCRGSVVNHKGIGHTIDLDVDVPAGRLEDFLALAVHTQPVVMSATITMKTKLHLRPGKESVTEKLGLRGGFTLTRVHFNNPAVQDKVDILSLRAQGLPGKAVTGAEDVRSRMDGTFTMASGKLSLPELRYAMPGVNVRLNGIYSLDGNQFDFRGTVRTDATISHMVASPSHSLLLRPLHPFFRKHGAAAEIPVNISSAGMVSPRCHPPFWNVPPRTKPETSAHQITASPGTLSQTSSLLTRIPHAELGWAKCVGRSVCLWNGSSRRAECRDAECNGGLHPRALREVRVQDTDARWSQALRQHLRAAAG